MKNAQRSRGIKEMPILRMTSGANEHARNVHERKLRCTVSNQPSNSSGLVMRSRPGIPRYAVWQERLLQLAGVNTGNYRISAHCVKWALHWLAGCWNTLCALGSERRRLSQITAVYGRGHSLAGCWNIPSWRGAHSLESSEARRPTLCADSDRLQPDAHANAGRPGGMSANAQKNATSAAPESTKFGIELVQTLRRVGSRPHAAHLDECSL